MAVVVFQVPGVRVRVLFHRLGQAAELRIEGEEALRQAQGKRRHAMAEAAPIWVAAVLPTEVAAARGVAVHSTNILMLRAS